MTLLTFFDAMMLYLHFQAKLAYEKIPVPKIYHPFICGPDNKYVQDLMQKYDIKINVPPFSVMKDEISVSGGKEGVQIVAQHIRKIYEEKVILTIM
jgi:hypothetical protein